MAKKSSDDLGLTSRETAMGKLRPLPGFLEEQLWAVRDRADSLRPLGLPEPAASKLALIFDELADAALLLRRPTRTNREGVAALIALVRRRLEHIEREAWPERPAM